jgi:hypothetical protein
MYAIRHICNFLVYQTKTKRTIDASCLIFTDRDMFFFGISYWKMVGTLNVTPVKRKVTLRV